MIAAMKRLLLLAALAAAALFLFPAPLGARADEAERYAVAAATDVWFYAAENEESGLFVLPYTYYVRVLKEGAVFSYVQYLDDEAPYKAIRGYCKTEDLTFVDFIPERPYLKREITVSYTVANTGDSLMGGGSFDKLEKSFVFYGTSYLGTARFFYVYADGTFDYVPATQEIVYEYNTDYLEDVSGGAPAEPEPPAGSLSGVQIAVICAIAAALVAIAVFVLRGKKSPTPQELPEF